MVGDCGDAASGDADTECFVGGTECFDRDDEHDKAEARGGDERMACLRNS